MPDIYMTSQYTLDGAWHLWHGPVLTTDGQRIPDRVVPRISDEHLAFWGQVYADNHIHAHGIRFEYFITAPEEFLDALERRRIYRHAADDYEPLLPAQARVARRVELQTPLGLVREGLDDVPDAVIRDGRLIEPLHHCRFPRVHGRRAV